MKLIALDVGTKRIGVAKADSDVRIAVPYSAVEVDGNEFTKLASLARAWGIEGFVIGLPRNSQGEETEQSRYVREFAHQLKRAIPTAKICFQDESLTSVEAEKRLEKRKKGYQKGDIDSEAATIILQDFLEAHTGKRTPAKPAAAKRPTVKAKKSHKLPITLAIIAVLLVGAGAGAGIYYNNALQPVDATNCDLAQGDANTDTPNPDATNPECTPVTFTVSDGDGVSTVATNLKNAGLIRDALVFQIYYRLGFGEQTIKAGEYNLSQSMTPQDIITKLIDGGNDNVFAFTFLPGATLRDFRAQLLEQGYTIEAIDAALVADYSAEEFAWVFDGKPVEATLEGYLYGETYEFYKDESVENIIKRMIGELAKVVAETGVQTLFAERGLNLYQGLTLASVVQKEANNFEDYARVAQVFYNRMALGMNLGSDVTVQYAVDLVDPDRLTYTDNALALTIDSPYNTRLYAGLTPGPISNPGRDAIVATATPDGAFANHLFFLTGDDGMMYYSITEVEHQQNISAHCQTLCNVAL